MADAQVLHGVDVTENTSASTTWVNGATIAAGSFTANKEYLILAVMCLDSSAGTTDMGYRLVYGATPTEFADADTAMDPVSSDGRQTVGWMYRFTQGGSTEAVTVQFNRKEGTGTVTHMYSTIIAIKLSDDFVEGTNVIWQEITADDVDAATFTNRAAVTFTPNGTDKWLIIGQASPDPTATGVNHQMEIQDSVAPTS